MERNGAWEWRENRDQDDAKKEEKTKNKTTQTSILLRWDEQAVSGLSWCKSVSFHWRQEAHPQVHHLFLLFKTILQLTLPLSTVHSLV